MQQIKNTTHKIKLTMPGYFDRNGYTYIPYDFSYDLPPMYELNPKLNTLIYDEIKKLSWKKLIEWNNNNNNNNNNRTSHIIYCMSQEYLENIGQIAANNLLVKCKTVEELDKLYDYEEEQKKIKESNSCDFCGEQLEKCSILCDRHTFSK
jgi:hypothetical protein